MIGSTLLLIITIASSLIASTPTVGGGIFLSSLIGNAERFSPFLPTPMWIFGVLSIIFMLLIVWHIYDFIIYFTCKHIFLHQPIVIFPIMYVLFSFVCILHFIWLFLQDRKLVWPSTLILFTMFIVLLISLIYGVLRLKHVKDHVEYIASNKYACFAIFITFNSVALYMMWVSILMILEFGSAIIHSHNEISKYKYTITCIGLLSFELVCYILLDLFLFIKTTKWILTPYLLFTWVSSGIVINRPHDLGGLSALVLAISCLASLSKLIYIFLDIRTLVTSNTLNQYEMFKCPIREQKHLRK